jgi:hypothetical protein
VAWWASHRSFYSRVKAVPPPGGAHAELVRLQWRFGRCVCGGVNAPLWPCCWTRLVEQWHHLVVCEPGSCSGERRRDAGGGLWPWWRSEVMAQAGEAAGSKWWSCSTGRGGQRRSYGSLRHRDAVVLCSQGDGSTAAAPVARCGLRGSGDDRSSRRSQWWSCRRAAKCGQVVGQHGVPSREVAGRAALARGVELMLLCVVLCSVRILKVTGR